MRVLGSVERVVGKELRRCILLEDFECLARRESAEQKGVAEMKGTRNSRLIFPTNMLVMVSSFTVSLLLVDGTCSSIVYFYYHIHNDLRIH